MDAKELRIGNWVIGYSEIPQKVAYIGDVIGIENSIGGVDRYQKYPIISYDISTLQPIPLSPEILEKCGFGYQSMKGGLTYYAHRETGFTLLYSYGKWNWSSSASVTSGKAIEYLHQLQNLYFALTGEELEVNLIHIDVKNSLP